MSCEVQTKMIPMISVIMPVYNTKAEYLREAIDSILTQTYKNFEFIIIDDGSKNPEVKETIYSYKDERIKYFYKKNTGVADSLNYGIEKAAGKYIARMDSDDISKLERLEKQVYFLETHPEISLVGSWIEYFPEKKYWRTQQFPGLLDFFYKNQIAHPSVMFRKADFEKYNLKYNPKFAAEDYELWTRVAALLRICNIQEPLLKYRLAETQVTHSNKNAIQKSQEEIITKLANHLTADLEILQKIKKIYAMKNKEPSFFQHLINVAYHLFKQGISFLSELSFNLWRFGKSIITKKNNFNLQDTRINDAILLHELNELGEFCYMPNSGNMGDALIAAATLNWFNKNKLKYHRITKEEFPKKFVYGGGGGWINLWVKSYKPIMEKMSKAEKIIVLPSSFENVPEFIDILDERFVIFCREQKSYDYLISQNTKAKIILDHDMAFRLDKDFKPQPIPTSRKLKKLTKKLKKATSTLPQEVKLFRTDSEALDNKKTDFDLSDALGWFSPYETKETLDFAATTMLNFVSSFKTIQTDRLHVAIASTLMGKDIMLFDNSYGKCSGVYKQTLHRFDNVKII